jgi:hypothetical protein
MSEKNSDCLEEQLDFGNHSLLGSKMSQDISKIKNRWHAKKTREKKKVYMNSMKERLQFLEMEVSY